MAKVKQKIKRDGTNQNYVPTNTDNKVINTEGYRPKKEASYMTCNFGGAF